MARILGYATILLMVLTSGQMNGQNSNKEIELIIHKIQELESRKDAKCYATANRLEDFMYGTPLTEEARNIRIDIQKTLALYIKDAATLEARLQNLDEITIEIANIVVSKLVSVGKLKNGNFFIRLSDRVIEIKATDFRQYSSVSYAYRSLLSLEQDLLVFSQERFLPFTEDALSSVYYFINLMTLGALQISDENARQQGKNVIDDKALIEGWYQLLNGLKTSGLKQTQYPGLKEKAPNSSQAVLHKIIDQKLVSYQEYNQLNRSVFLRNIQVFFAKQMWPTENEASDGLKNYLLESLILFADVLILESQKYAQLNQHSLIRLSDVQKGIENLTPFEANMFEDITFFPNNKDESITIESYDLDAFRDSGMHWQILKYALSDYESKYEKAIDPHAAELIVEGIAQMGVLVLRLAGRYSKDANKAVLDPDDIKKAFETVQRLISTYENYSDITGPDVSASVDGTKEITDNSFTDITEFAGISFQHKSSDWLSRKIRSYVTTEDNTTIRLGIPPAFGGSGVAADDLNNDGWDDILLLGGFGNRLYLNNKKGGFDESPLSGKLSLWSDGRDSYGEPRQCIIADFDNDGWKDIFITYVDAPHKLYKNVEGLDFEDVSELANLGGTGEVAGPATAFDYNNDGLLDIVIGYFGNYLEGYLPTLSRNNQNGDPNVLFQNSGAFQFVQVENPFEGGNNNGWTQAMGHTDLNRDGWQDLIVGNDFGINEYYLNNGDGSFKEVADEIGTGKPSYTMNVGIGDLNRDRYPDFYISNIVVMQKDEKYVSPNEETTMKFDPEKMKTIRTVEANDLFMSTGESLQFEQAENIGRGYGSTGWSWDADFFDYDNDGDDDLYVLNGMNDFSVYGTENESYYNSEGAQNNVEYASSHRERNVFFENQNGTLINSATERGLDLLSNSRSAAYLDYDNDGDLDIIINNYHDGAVLMQNDLQSDFYWIKVTLSGDPDEKVNKDAIGTVIIANTKNHKGLWREIHSTDGYLSVHPKTQHIGLGMDIAVDLTVIWPNGKQVEINNLNTKRHYLINYPDSIKVQDKK